MEQQNNKPDKLTDKAFSRLMLTSVLSILVCIVCVCSATWAWFSADTSSSGNKLATGKFDLTVSVTDESSVVTTLAENAVGKTVYTFENVGVYTLKLKMTDDTTVTKGFCTLVVGDDTYYTASINAETDPFTFTIDVKEAGVTVMFSPAWGYPSAEEQVDMNETLVIGSTSTPQG